MSTIFLKELKEMHQVSFAMGFAYEHTSSQMPKWFKEMHQVSFAMGFAYDRAYRQTSRWFKEIPLVSFAMGFAYDYAYCQIPKWFKEIPLVSFYLWRLNHYCLLIAEHCEPKARIVRRLRGRAARGRETLRVYPAKTESWSLINRKAKCQRHSIVEHDGNCLSLCLS